MRKQYEIYFATSRTEITTETRREAVKFAEGIIEAFKSMGKNATPIYIYDVFTGDLVFALKS